MADWYHAAEFTFIPSLEEAISLAALEAMGSGSLVLCTPVGGLLELITDGQNGLMSADVSVPHVRELFLRANSLPVNVHNNLTSSARSHVQVNYTWESIAVQMLNKMKAHSLI
jgi:glycosyltransferase involved in cell wall biosynthesis